jgi:rfaE bifunctional protein nucleotidyltransferase chain/domain
MGNAPVAPAAKLLSLPELLRRYGRPRAGSLVFTNGCFDILHRGHVEYLDHARRLGDLLVIGLNTDSSVRRLKGPERPINGEIDRATVIAGLAAVDAVVLFDEDTPRELVARLLPDIIVKGGDYRADEIAGAEEVIAAGGKVVVAPLVPGQSTTRIVHRSSTARREATEWP